MFQNIRSHVRTFVQRSKGDDDELGMFLVLTSPLYSVWPRRTCVAQKPLHQVLCDERLHDDGSHDAISHFSWELQRREEKFRQVEDQLEGAIPRQRLNQLRLHEYTVLEDLSQEI